MQKLCKKHTASVTWKPKEVNSKKKHQSKVEIVLPELDTTKIISRNFHLNDSHGNHKYDVILGRDILSELQVCLCFSDKKIRVNGGAY